MSKATYRLEPLVPPSSFMLHSPWVEGWGVDFPKGIGTMLGLRVIHTDSGSQSQTRIHRATKSCPELVEGNTSSSEVTASLSWAATVCPDAHTPECRMAPW